MLAELRFEDIELKQLALGSWEEDVFIVDGQENKQVLNSTIRTLKRKSSK